MNTLNIKTPLFIEDSLKFSDNELYLDDEPTTISVGHMLTFDGLHNSRTVARGEHRLCFKFHLSTMIIGMPDFHVKNLKAFVAEDSLVLEKDEDASCDWISAYRVVKAN